MDKAKTLAGDIFDAFRNSEKLGRGSCSTIDECFSDEELMEHIEENLAEGIYTSVQDAVAWELRLDKIRAEREGDYY